MNKLFTQLNANYNLAFPESVLSNCGISKEIFEKLVNENGSFALQADTPNWFHSALVDLFIEGGEQKIYAVAVDENREKYVAVEDLQSSVGDTNCALLLHYENTSNKILKINSFGLSINLEFLKQLIVALMFRDNFGTYHVKLMDLIKRYKNHEQISEQDMTEAYFNLFNALVDTLYNMDDETFLNSTNNSLKEITKEYLNATTEFQTLTCLTAFQAGYTMPADPLMFKFFSPLACVDNAQESGTNGTAQTMSYTISEHRKFSEAEQEMMANTAMRMPNYVPSQVALDLVGAFYATNKANFGSPLRAALLYGESGTGKTEMVQYLGYKLGIPVTSFQCSANTDENDLLGKPISLGLSGDDGKITYTETELVRAVKNGWIIEIQEAASVKETAVLQIFNALLDGTELLQLPDGTQLTPHPNFMMVFTTNVSYEGCTALNQSLISRNQFVQEVQLPTDEEFKERLVKQLCWPKKTSKKPIDEAIKTMHKIKKYLQENYLTDGSCDFRAIKDWLQLYLAYNKVGIKKNLAECAEYTVIPKATLESEHHEAIRALCQAIVSA